MRRIILSRKGFDSSSGGEPSPIFADGRIISLPIPDRRTDLRYKDINIWNYNLGSIVDDLTRGKVRPDWNLHLDPDLNPNCLIRDESWRPIFGQVGAAQGHLRNQGVSVGDLFLFFGLFKQVVTQNGRLMFCPQTPAKHLIWGWLQIGEIVKVDDIAQDQLDWARYHPHFNRAEDKSNTLYISSGDLNLPGTSPGAIAGAGIFEHSSERRQLTQSEASSPTHWELPTWFFPENGRCPLTYHGNMDRWELTADTVLLSSVSRGQEFVLQLDQYPKPEVHAWLVSLLTF